MTQSTLLLQYSLLGFLLISFVRCADIRERSTRWVVVLFLWAMTLRYLIWRWQATLPPFEIKVTNLWQWFFFSVEFVALSYEAWSEFVMTGYSDRTEEADGHQNALMKICPDLWPIVDVYIATFNEPKSILTRTIDGALALRYPKTHLNIWVLDDGHRDCLRRHCEAKGVNYLARKDSGLNGKAGNHNHAFPRTNGEFLLLLDADFVVLPNILERLVGFLLFSPTVAILQTPQTFRNPDCVQHNLGIAHFATEEQQVFMRRGLSARDSYEASFCVGTCCLVRRSAIAEIGGFPFRTLCEDWELSQTLRATTRMETIFLNEKLSTGLAPESVPEFIKQRVRWCLGTLQHLFIPHGPLFSRRFSFFQRLCYFDNIAYWYGYPFLVLLLIAPVIFWWTGVSAIPCVGDEAWLLIVPRCLSRAILKYFLTGWKSVPLATTVSKCLPAFHITWVLLTFWVKTTWNFAPPEEPFRVTSKGGERDQPRIDAVGLFRCFTILSVGQMIGVFVNLSGLCQIVPIDSMTSLNLLWAAFSITVTALCAMACIEQPIRPGYYETKETTEGSFLGTIRGLLWHVIIGPRSHSTHKPMSGV